MKEIEIYAFQNCTSLEDVVFPEGLTTIRAFAYYGSGIKSVDFPDSLTSLGKQVIIISDTEVGSVFYNCKILKALHSVRVLLLRVEIISAAAQALRNWISAAA